MTFARKTSVPLAGVAAALGLTCSLLSATAHATPVSTNATTPGAASASTLSSVSSVDRESVIDGYRNVFLPASYVPPTSTADVSTCTPGTPSAESIQSALDMTNYARALVGFPALTASSTLQKTAQEAALALTANGELSHFPPDTWKCLTAGAKDALGRSSLALGGAPAIPGFLDDSGDRNVNVGHRATVLSAQGESVGLGITSGATVFSIQHRGTDRLSQAGPAIRTWPTEGYFPEQLLPESNRWSFNVTDRSRSQLNLENATLTYERLSNGRLTKFPAPITYRNSSMLVFNPDNTLGARAFGRDMTYRVTLSNLTTLGGKPAPDYSYDVVLVDAMADSNATFTSRPTVQGTPTVGVPYRVTAGTYHPVLDTDRITYTWTVDGSPVGTGPTITPTLSMLGRELKVEQKIQRVGDIATTAAAVASSAGTVVYVGAPAVVKPPRIFDSSFATGAVIGFDPGEWAGTVSHRTYQWYRNDDPIPGATASTYALTPDDAEAWIRVQESAHSGTGAVTSVFSDPVRTAAYDPVPQFPENLVPPSVTGSLVAGQSVTGNDGTWSDATSIRRQWLCNGAAISGATAKTLNLTANHVGCYLTYYVEATGSRGTSNGFHFGLGAPVVAASTSITPPGSGGGTGGGTGGGNSNGGTTTPTKLKSFKVTGKVAISGTVKIGKKLTAKKPKISPAPAKVTYQWYRAGKAISKATKATYKLVKADKKKNITVKVTITKSGYKTATSTSVAKKPTK